MLVMHARILGLRSADRIHRRPHPQGRGHGDEPGVACEATNLLRLLKVADPLLADAGIGVANRRTCTAGLRRPGSRRLRATRFVGPVDSSTATRYGAGRVICASATAAASSSRRWTTCSGACPMAVLDGSMEGLPFTAGVDYASARARKPSPGDRRSRRLPGDVPTDADKRVRPLCRPGSTGRHAERISRPRSKTSSAPRSGRLLLDVLVVSPPTACGARSSACSTTRRPRRAWRAADARVAARRGAPSRPGSIEDSLTTMLQFRSSTGSGTPRPAADRHRVSSPSPRGGRPRRGGAGRRRR